MTAESLLQLIRGRKPVQTTCRLNLSLANQKWSTIWFPLFFNSPLELWKAPVLEQIGFILVVPYVLND